MIKLQQNSKTINKMENSLKYIFLLLVAVGCSSSDQKIEKLQDDVMAIHDEVMPKMGEIMNLKDELANNLKAIDSTSANYRNTKAMSDSLSYLLTESDNGMMDWMDEYNPDTLKAINAEDGEKYLTEQKNKINSIKESTIKNIEVVRKYLKK
ncbi:MAG: hypothetical protein V4683_13755 [Bacteroidota bacterium]